MPFWEERPLNFIRTITVAVLALAVTAGIADARKLSFTTSGNPNEPATQASMAWAELIKERTNGELEIEFFYQQSLSKLPDNLSAIADGVADMGTVIPAYSRKDMPLTYLSSTATGSGNPYVVNTAWQATREAFPQLEAEDEKNNIMLLAASSIGPVLLIGNKAYNSPDDFDGAAMRLSSHFARAAKANDWSVSPTRIRFPEMYTALEKGTITGGSAYMSQILPYNLQEVARFGTVLNLGQHMNQIYMSRDTWNSLTDSQRQVISDSLPELAALQTRKMVEAIEADLENVQNDAKYPMRVVELSEEERAVWSEQMAVAQKLQVSKAAEVDPAAAEIAEFYLSKIGEVTEDLNANGYPWQ